MQDVVVVQVVQDSKSYFARIVVDTRGLCWDENGMGWDGMG